MEKKYFKGAVFGGFDRHDVLAYIEEQAKERRVETDKLMSKFKETLTSNETLEKRSAELSEKAKALEEENEAVRQKLEQMMQTALSNEAAISELNSSLAQKDSEIERLKVLLSNRESENLRQTAQINEQTEYIEKLQQALSVFEMSRQRVADIELAAFRRAEDIEKTAISNAERARDTLRKLLVDAKSKYDSVKSDVDVTMLHIIKELDGVKGQLGALSPVMDIIGERMDTLGYYDPKQSPNFTPRLEPLEDEEYLPPLGPEAEALPDTAAVPEAAFEEPAAIKTELEEEPKPAREYIENPLMAHRIDNPLTAEAGGKDAEAQMEGEEPLEKPSFKIYRQGQ